MTDRESRRSLQRWGLSNPPEYYRQLVLIGGGMAVTAIAIDLGVPAYALLLTGSGAMVLGSYAEFIQRRRRDVSGCD